MSEVFPFIVAFALLFGLSFVAAYAQTLREKQQPKPKTVEDLDQDAAWYRAHTRMTDAKKDYEMAEAHLRDQRRFIQKHIGGGHA